MPKRYEFEKKNLNETGARSFKLDGFKADIVFEFSSEGEFQRIKYLLDDLLRESDFKCELVFCSPSVEKIVLDYYKLFPDKIRYYRLTNLLRGSAFLTRWVSAKKLVMVQYDFFPQLLNLRSMMEKMILISPKVDKIGFYKSWCLSFFDLFLLDEPSESHAFKNKDTIIGSLRELVIIDRKKKSRDVLISTLPWFAEFEKKVLNNSERKIIFGNYWHDEFSYIDIGDFPTVDDVLVIVPHELDNQQAQQIIKDLKSVSRVSQSESPDYAKNIFLFSVKGVLCELYQYFDLAYIGGGFERNVHSLLEPFLAGCYCVSGENVDKSNEYKMIMNQAPDRIEIHSKINIDSIIQKVLKNRGNIPALNTDTSWYREFKSYLSGIEAKKFSSI